MVKTDSEELPLIKINLSEILRNRLPHGRGKLIPGFLLKGLEKLVRQERLNELLERCYPARGSEFASRLLEELGVTLEVKGLENLAAGEKYEFASNHPLGGLDGIALVAVLGAHYGDAALRVLVNDMLMHVTPLGNVFLPVNKYGSQGREAARNITRAFEEGKQIVMFPAGLVSRIQPDGGIRDLAWQKAFVAKALEHGRQIVPVRFEGLNSRRFYRCALWRKRLGLKVNLEQALLPSELCDAEGSRYRITFLKPVDPARLREKGYSPQAIAAAIRKLLYPEEK